VPDLTLKANGLVKKVYPNWGGRIFVVTAKSGPIGETWTTSGWAGKNYIVIPKWLFRYSEKYLIKYYILHELSHILSHESKHNKKFYDIFKKICPRELWHYEREYVDQSYDSNMVKEKKVRDKIIKWLEEGNESVVGGRKPLRRMPIIGLDNEDSWDIEVE